jgi:mxaJ protein
MSSLFPSYGWMISPGWRIYAVTILLCITFFSAACAYQMHARSKRKLRVCADPNNLPFSNERREGFENKLAELLARELNAELEYTWWAQHRGFIRNTLQANRCDVVMGVPTRFEMALTTTPYYRSTYVFVTRQGEQEKITSFDDPALRKLRVGVQVIGDDGANSPPAHALARRGIVQNVRGYTVYGDYRKENPPARILEAVAQREIDVAIAWGPLAGYFAKRQRVPLQLSPITPQIDQSLFPFVYDISLGVRQGDKTFKQELEAVLEHKRAEIESLLDCYGIPRVRE